MAPRRISICASQVDSDFPPAQRTLPSTFVLFRKEFDLSSTPIAARGWIAADSRYQLTVNGRRVQWGPAPCDPRHLDADPFDLKPFLKAGKNVIGVEVLFYGHGDGTWPGGQPGLIMNLEVQTAEGKSQILTDKHGRRSLTVPIATRPVQAVVPSGSARAVRCPASSLWLEST